MTDYKFIAHTILYLNIFISSMTIGIVMGSELTNKHDFVGIGIYIIFALLLIFFKKCITAKSKLYLIAFSFISGWLFMLIFTHWYNSDYIKNLIIQTTIIDTLLLFILPVLVMAFRQQLSGILGFIIQTLLGVLVLFVMQYFWNNTWIELSITTLGVMILTGILSASLKNIDQRYKPSEYSNAATDIFIKMLKY